MPPSPEFDPEQSGILPKKYPDLQQSRPVEQAVNHVEHLEHKPVPNDPDARISLYLQKLEQRHSVFQPKQDDPADEVRRQQARDRFAASFAIKQEDIPEGYFANQQRLARERGYGDIQITPEMRQQMADAIRQDQIASLSRWIDYMRGPDVNYPTWFKYFTLRNVTQLSGYNKERQAFRQRSAGTTAPFPDLNREALAYVYGNFARQLQGEKTNDPKLQQLLQGANFSKLYAYAIQRAEAINPESHKQTIGSWRKYDQNSNAKSLSDSLQGHNTSWCTAEESTAQIQLQGGDFYVYYSRDDQGQDTVPRIAIRMENGQVAEIRGINKDQELEPELIDTAMAQAKKLPGGDMYFKKAEDMQRLTEVEHKTNQGKELTKDEILFLYEINGKIEGFGHSKDPRVYELQNTIANLKSLITTSSQLPNGSEHKEIAEAVMQITNIENKTKHKELLNKSEIGFIYEMSPKIEVPINVGWTDGWLIDRRVKEILNTRNRRFDFAIYLDTEPENIIIDPSEAITSKTVAILYGSIPMTRLYYKDSGDPIAPNLASIGEAHKINPEVKIDFSDVPNNALSYKTLLKLRELGCESQIISNLRCFKQLDQQIASNLIKRNKMNEIQAFYNKFTQFNESDIDVLFLSLIDNINQKQTIVKQQQKELASQTKESQNRWKLMESQLRAEIKSEISNYWHRPTSLRFKSDREIEDIIRRRIDAAKQKEMPSLQKAAQDLNKNKKELGIYRESLRKLLNDNSDYLMSTLSRYKDLPDFVADDLIESGLIENVVNNLESFKHLKEKTMIELAQFQQNYRRQQ